MNVGTVAEAVTTLYGGDPADFVAVRKELAAAARTAGERDAAREIAALRKPTAAAAAVNHLDDGAIRDVLALGEQMRAAQTSLDAATLKELSARRQELLQQIVTRHDLNGALAEAVRATLLAAIADRQAADAVETRALVRPLSYSGWGDVDLTDAVAHRDASARPTLRLVAGGAPAQDRTRGAAATTSASSTSSAADEASPQVADSQSRRDEDEQEKAERQALDHEKAERQAAERESAQRRRAAQEQREAAALAEMDARIARLRARVEAAQNAYDAARAARDSARAALEEALLRRSSMPGGTSSSSSS